MGLSNTAFSLQLIHTRLWIHFSGIQPIFPPTALENLCIFFDSVTQSHIYPHIPRVYYYYDILNKY